MQLFVETRFLDLKDNSAYKLKATCTLTSDCLPHWGHSHAHLLSAYLTFTRHAGPFSPGNGKFKSRGGEQLGEMR